MAIINTMEKEPKITVITSLYKAGHFLESFLQDIRNQTIFEELDWHFIDANSPDMEYERLLEFQKVNENVRISRELKRIGIYAAWNKGVKKSKAKYISNLNVDDKLSYDYYEIMFNFLENNKEFDVAYSNVLISTNINDTFYSVDVNKPDNRLRTASYCDLHSLSHLGAVHNCPVWRKSIHEDVGLFDETLNVAGDTDFWMRAVIAGKKIKKLDAFLALYFLNPHGISTELKGEFVGLNSEAHQEVLMLRQKYEKEINEYGLQNFYNYIDSQR
jgi:glycosyltransferase involved in cell wall biosynthesis